MAGLDFKSAKLEENDRSPHQERILFICGSLNQTMIMHKISRNFKNAACFFTPYYATGFLGALARRGLLDFSILGGRHRRACMHYLHKHHLPLDLEGRNGPYDLVITGSDIIIPANIRKSRILLVQEGMLEKENWLFPLVCRLRFLRFFANTAATGQSKAYDAFCVASEGYRAHFISRGIDPAKMIVTGIPNFDNAASYLKNDFPHHHYVLALTSSIRETFGHDDREGFLKRLVSIAAGRKVIFKLHPNENPHRAIREIRKYFPDSDILLGGDAHAMIANCDVLVAQNSSAIFIAYALGKEVHSYLDKASMLALMPVQNNGTSDKRIASVGFKLLETPLQVLRQSYSKPAPRATATGRTNFSDSKI